MKVQERRLTRANCTLHYWLYGREDRPLIVCTHGATMDHAMFTPQIEILAQEYRVLTWDVRGHGKSRPLAEAFTLQDCADDLIAVLDALDVEKAVLMGQSMGGYISQYAYLCAPERVQAMIIIGSTNIAFPLNRWEALALGMSLPVFSLLPYKYYKRLVAKSTSVKPDVQAYALATINTLSQADFLKIWKPVTLAVNEQGIPGHQIKVPLLLTHGDHDNTGTIRRDAPRWAAYEPEVEYAVIPDAGHNANQDNPAYFNRVLTGFLRKHVPVGAYGGTN